MTIRQTCGLPPRVDTKPSDRPSGAQRGAKSLPGPAVSARAAPPAAGTTQMRETFLLSSRDGVLTVNATVAPSGESCGSPTLLSAMKDSKVIGCLV